MSIFDLKCMHQFLQGMFRFSVKYGQYLTTEGKVQGERGSGLHSCELCCML